MITIIVKYCFHVQRAICFSGDTERLPCFR